MTFSTMDSTASPLLIAGLGSPHGDDQAGWIALERLRPRLPSGVNLQRLTLPIDLLSHLGSPQALLIIDAAAPAGRPGAWRHFSWPCRDFVASTAWCTHGLGLVETLRLAETLGTLPPHVALYTLEAVKVEPLAGLSPAVDAGLEALVEVLAEAAASILAAAGSRHDECASGAAPAPAPTGTRIGKPSSGVES